MSEARKRMSLGRRKFVAVLASASAAAQSLVAQQTGPQPQNAGPPAPEIHNRAAARQGFGEAPQRLP